MLYPIGFTSYANPGSAFVEVNQDGSAVLWVGAADVGQGSTTVLAQIAAEVLGIGVDDLRVVSADTTLTPFDMGSVASRVTYIVGNAVRSAALQAKQILYEVAAEELGVSPTGLACGGGFIYMDGFPERRIALAAAARKAYLDKGRPPIGAASYQPATTMLDPETGQGKPYGTYVFATQIAEVEVDPETGEVEVLKITAVHDCGKAINPLLVEGQIQGGVAMGVGYGLMEEMVIAEGRVLNPQFTDYVLPTALDMPEIVTDIVERPEPTGPFGAKGIGEPSLLPTAPAIVNAIQDAIGVRIRDLPATPEKILRALADRRNEAETPTRRST